MFKCCRKFAFSERKISYVRDNFRKKTVLQRITREVGIISMVDDLAGEKLRTRLTSGTTCRVQGHNGVEKTDQYAHRRRQNTRHVTD